MRVGPCDGGTERGGGYLGYVQGMSDLCAPVYVVMGGDEEMTFWCFVEIMDRMVRGRPCGLLGWRLIQAETEREFPA